MITHERKITQPQTPEWKLWENGYLVRQCLAPRCGATFTKRDLYRGRGRQHGEHPDHDYRPCGHNHERYAAVSLGYRREIPGEWDPMELVTRLEGGFVLWSRDGDPWLAFQFSKLPAHGWDFHPRMRAILHEAASAYLRSEQGLTDWTARPECFNAAETLVELLALEVDPATALLQNAEANADRYDLTGTHVVQKAVA